MSYVIINFVVVMTSPVNKGQAARSLLSKLRASTQLELMRKRKVRVNALSHTGTRKERPTYRSVRLLIIIGRFWSSAA